MNNFCQCKTFVLNLNLTTHDKHECIVERTLQEDIIEKINNFQQLVRFFVFIVIKTQ